MSLDFKIEVAKRVKTTRKEHGETIKDIAEILGYDESFISKVESGRSALSAENAVKLADHWGISTDDILRRVENNPPSKNDCPLPSDYVIAATNVWNDIKTLTKAFGMSRNEAKELLKIAALYEIAETIMEYEQERGNQ